MVPPVVTIGDKVNWSISKIALNDMSWVMLTVVCGAFIEATLWPNQETKEYPVTGIASIDASVP